MSLSAEPDFTDYVNRISDILSLSADLFPKSIGGSATEEDLVTQVIEFDLPLPSNPIEGPGPPHYPPKPGRRAMKRPDR